MFRRIALPGQASLPASWIAPDLLVTESLSPFNTPYSFVRARSAAVAHASKTCDWSWWPACQPIASRAALDARTLITLPTTPSGAANPGEYVWTSQTVSQFRPSDAVSVAILVNASDATAVSSVMPKAAVTIGYDGRSAAVSVVRYWWPWLLAVLLLGLATLSPLPVTWNLQERTLRRWGRVVAGHTPSSLPFSLFQARSGSSWLSVEDSISTGTRAATSGASGCSTFSPRATCAPRWISCKLARSSRLSRRTSVGLALFQVVSAWPTGHAIAEPRDFSGEWLPASVLSMASVCSIGLTYGIARRSGATTRQSFLAAFLLAASSAMLMHARHFFPYNAAMATLLLSLWIGLRTDGRLVRSYGAGLIAGFGFLIYTGYWLLATVVALVHVLRRPFTVRHSSNALFSSLSVARRWWGPLIVRRVHRGSPVFRHVR